jgi:hypothetical protein
MEHNSGRPPAANYPYAERLLRVEREIRAVLWRLAELREQQCDFELTLEVLDPEWLADHMARTDEGLS